MHLRYQCVDCGEVYDTKREAQNCHSDFVQIDESGVEVRPYLIPSPIGYYVDEYDEWKFERLLSDPFGR